MVRSGAPAGHQTTIHPLQPPFEFLTDLFAGHFLHLDVTFPCFLAQQRPCVKSPSLPKYAPASIERPHQAWDRLGAHVADLSTGRPSPSSEPDHEESTSAKCTNFGQSRSLHWRVCLKALGFPMFYDSHLRVDFCSWLGPSIYFSPDARTLKLKLQAFDTAKHRLQRWYVFLVTSVPLNS